MRAKKCPHCHQAISHDRLKSSGHHKAFIKREVFPCPNCETPIQLPQKAEKLLSIGILCSVIIAPLSYFWLLEPTLGYLLFINGAILILIGSLTNKLVLAKHQSKNKVKQAAPKEEIKEAHKGKDNDD
jgi:hypothetical protein